MDGFSGKGWPVVVGDEIERMGKKEDVPGIVFRPFIGFIQAHSLTMVSLTFSPL